MVKVLWKETAFLRCKATDSRWNRKPVSLVSWVTADILLLLIIICYDAMKLAFLSLLLYFHFFANYPTYSSYTSPPVINERKGSLDRPPRWLSCTRNANQTHNDVMVRTGPQSELQYALCTTPYGVKQYSRVLLLIIRRNLNLNQFYRSTIVHHIISR